MGGATELCVTDLWPASCCMDGMAKKLFRELEAAENTEGINTEGLLWQIYWSVNLKNFFTFTFTCCNCSTDLWWDTHPDSQRHGRGQSSSPGAGPQVSGPALDPRMSGRHLHSQLCLHILQTALLSVEQRKKREVKTIRNFTLRVFFNLRVYSMNLS